jgi:hypothetical protein
MQVRHQGEVTTVELGQDELRLLRRALERASFIDTPPSEQPAILAFCTRALDTLPRS